MSWILAGRRWCPTLRERCFPCGRRRNTRALSSSTIRGRGTGAISIPGDPKGAEGFYGAVFGWEVNTGSLDGIGDYAMLRSPGYGAFLEASDPDIFRRQADVGAPEGFADAIAWMMPMAPDQYPEDVPSHWSVTFAVDDTDVIADRAVALGGDVILAPFDAGVVRAAVLSDPQGAVFSVSKYDPT